METRTQKIYKWSLYSTLLAKYKKLENRYRVEIFRQYFSNVPLGTSYSADGKIKIVKRQNVTIAKSEVIQEKAGELSPELLDLLYSCIEWKPTLILERWLELTPEQQNLFSWLVTFKDGLPSLSLTNEPESE